MHVNCIFVRMNASLSNDLSERIIVSWGDESRGPLLCFLAGIHGNEPAGVLALERVLCQLRELDLPLHGRVVGLKGNLAALDRGERYVDTDLNRLWSKDQIQRVTALSKEDRNTDEQELVELLSLLSEFSGSGQTPQIYVDLHTTSAKGGAFSVVANYASHRALAECLPVPMIFGLAPALAHTTNRYFEERGLVGIAFEAGQHDDPLSIDRHEAAIWIFLAAVDIMEEEDIPDWEGKISLLQAAAGDLSQYQQVVYRHHIDGEDQFSMMPGFLNFQEIVSGQPLGHDRGGTVRSPEEGRILMPLYQAQGSDGFYIIKDLNTPPV